ncbi:hypothetical protein D1007_06019 [Hordeum vulgare]|nr:hypothetical protein D1007_06019 [Hordeum vulgare]
MQPSWQSTPARPQTPPPHTRRGPDLSPHGARIASPPERARSARASNPCEHSSHRLMPHVLAGRFPKRHRRPPETSLQARPRRSLPRLPPDSAFPLSHLAFTLPRTNLPWLPTKHPPPPRSSTAAVVAWIRPRGAKSAHPRTCLAVGALTSASPCPSLAPAAMDDAR